MRLPSSHATTDTAEIIDPRTGRHVDTRPLRDGQVTLAEGGDWLVMLR